MTTAGLIFMTISWGAILGLSTWCMWLLVQADRKDRGSHEQAATSASH